MKKFIWLGCITYFLIGLAHVVIGSVLEELLQYYDKDYKDGGLLIFLQFTGFLFGVLTAPWWSARLGRRGSVLFALSSLAAAEVIYSLLPGWSWMLAAAPLAGYGFGMVESAIGSSVIEFVEDQKAVAMSRLEVFFGLGAMVMPALAGILIKVDAWRWSFPLIVGLSIISILLFMFISFGKLNDKLAKRSPSSHNRDKVVVRTGYGTRKLISLAILAAFFLLYVGIEMSFVNFLPSILIDKLNVSTSVGAAGVSLFWASMVVGRFFSGTIAERIGYSKYLLISCIGATVIFAGLYLVSEEIASFAIVACMGLLMAGIFAIGLIYANVVLPGSTERTTSLLIASGGIGGAVLPLLTGYAMDGYSSTVSIGLLVMLMLVMTVFIIISTRLRSRDSKPQGGNEH